MKHGLHVNNYANLDAYGLWPQNQQSGQYIVGKSVKIAHRESSRKEIAQNQ